MNSIDLTPDEVKMLSLPVVGSGGFQSLLRALQRNLDGTRLRWDPALLERITRYADKYGAGGWQERLLGLASRMRS